MSGRHARVVFAVIGLASATLAYWCYQPVVVRQDGLRRASSRRAGQNTAKRDARPVLPQVPVTPCSQDTGIYDEPIIELRDAALASRLEIPDDASAEQARLAQQRAEEAIVKPSVRDLDVPEKPEQVPSDAVQTIAGLTWHTDYVQAMAHASKEQKMLFVFFHDDPPTDARRAFETRTLVDPRIRQQLRRYVLASLPVRGKIMLKGQSITLLRHAAFAEMLGRSGISIIDLQHKKRGLYGQVVSTFPFTAGKFYNANALTIILDLPAGTLTQRTMIYAVRIHPEKPASTQGQFLPLLAEEAKQHSTYQASITLQGHHSWDSRFQRISSQLPPGVMAQEVVAESWPNEGLVEACVDCVASWRQSTGHWGAVLGRHPLFGYDIKRGRNGIWYATGIFARR